MNMNLSKKVHPYFLTFIFFTCSIFGVGLSVFYKSSFFYSQIWFISFIILFFIISLKYNSLYIIPIVIALGFLLGFNRGNFYFINNNHLKNFINSSISISGKIAEDPNENNSSLGLRINNIEINHRKYPGEIYIKVDQKYKLKRSDRIIFIGKASKGFGHYPISMNFPKIKSIHRDFSKDTMLKYRDDFSLKINQEIPSPESSLGSGYLLGQKQALPKELSDALKVTGLTHAVVASGYNLTILVRLCRRLFAKYSRLLSIYFSSILTILFMSIIGDSPSMFRAGIVTLLSLIVWYYGRKIHPVFLIFFTASITLLANPGFLLGNISWLLSFTSFAGVLILAPLLKSYFFGDKKIKTLTQILIETVSAQILTLPIILYTFGLFSTVSIFTNLLILPFVPITMLFTFLTGVFGFIFSPLAFVFGKITYFILHYMILVINFFANLSWSSIDIKINLLDIFILYILIFIIIIYLKKKTKLDLNSVNLVK